MVNVIYYDQLVYKVVIWEFYGISLWTEKVVLNIILMNDGERWDDGEGLFRGVMLRDDGEGW